jgi:agmatinase
MTFDPNAAAAPDSGVFGLSTPKNRCLVRLIPVPFEATTSYGSGASRGPAGIFEASKQVDLFDLETGRPYEAGIWMDDPPKDVLRLNARAKREAAKVIAAGGVGNDPKLLRARAIVDRASETVDAYVYREALAALDEGRVVGVVGGDHATPYGLIRAVSERHPGIGILHIDAHADIRKAYEGFTWSHASIMFNVLERLKGVARIVQVGVRDFCEEEADRIAASKGRVRTHFDASLAARRHGGATWATLCKAIVADLPKEVYVSFDVDGLDPKLCPNTGTPVPGGLDFQEASALIGEVVRSGRRIVAFDLNEVAPSLDDAWDANVGARLLYKLIGWTLLSRASDRKERGPSAKKPANGARKAASPRRGR